MPNRTAPERGWELLQQAENAIYKEAAFDKARSLAALAQAYFGIPKATASNDQDDGVTVWIVYAGSPSSLTVTYTLETATGATAPAAAEVTWNVGDGVGTGTATVTTKALTSNVATLTTAAPHGMQVGQSATVAISDAVFDGTYTITAVTANTISYARTNANVTSTAGTGTARRSGLSTTHTYADRATYDVSVVVDTAALGPVGYSRKFQVPFGL